MLTWILIGAGVLIVAIIFIYYNRFSVLSNRIENSLSQIDVQLKRRTDLIPNTNFLELQRELASTEDKVAYSRQFYNDSILSYNNLCTTMPGLLFAKMFNRQVKEFFQVTAEERKEIKVKFEK